MNFDLILTLLVVAISSGSMIGGFFGMNVKVPGQDLQNMFWYISAIIIIFTILVGLGFTLIFTKVKHKV